MSALSSRSTAVEVVEANDWTSAAAGVLLDCCRAASAETTEFVVCALAGGRTPWPVYQLLDRHSEEDLDWKRFLFLATDERWAPSRGVESNEAGLVQSLLEPLGLDEAKLLAIPRAADSASAAASHHEKRILRKLGSPPRLDVAVLGLGADGHVASLFGGEEGATGWVAATKAPTKPVERITLTSAFLRRARRLVFLVAGAAKADAVADATNGAGAPALAAILEGHPHVHWVLDRAAAAGLPSRRRSIGAG